MMFQQQPDFVSDRKSFNDKTHPVLPNILATNSSPSKVCQFVSDLPIPRKFGELLFFNVTCESLLCPFSLPLVLPLIAPFPTLIQNGNLPILSSGSGVSL